MTILTNSTNPSAKMTKIWIKVLTIVVNQFFKGPNFFDFSNPFLCDGELHVDAAEDKVGPGLAVEAGLPNIVTLNNSLDSSELREGPLHVLEVDLTGSQRAATMRAGSNTKGDSEEGESTVGEMFGLGSADLRGEVLGVANLINTKTENRNNSKVIKEVTTWS